jgi:hypothetical protein
MLFQGQFKGIPLEVFRIVYCLHMGVYLACQDECLFEKTLVEIFKYMIKFMTNIPVIKDKND